MKKFLLGIFAGLIIAGVTVVVLVFASVKWSSRAPSIPDQVVLRLAIAGPLPEAAPSTIPLPAFEDRAPLTLVDVYGALKSAARDPRVKGVMLEPRALSAGWGKLSEVRARIEEIRKAGKPVYAWLQSPGMREYYLASAADKVYLSPEDILDVKGMRLEAMYFKGTLDKIGVQVEVEHAGKYKDAGDVFTRTSMSPETKEALNSILDSLYGEITASLAKGRGKTPQEMVALIDQGPFLAPVAQSSGMVDALIYPHDVREMLMKQTRVGEKGFISTRQYLASGGYKPKGARKRIAYLIAQGDILRASAADVFGEEQVITPATIGTLIRSISEDDSIAGVIVRVDSPGGDAVASDEILAQLKRLSEKKPLVFSMSDVAASGGYYIAMTGDPVVAYPGTLTGSIGVVFGKINLRGLYDKLGVSVDTLKRGRYADIDSSTSPMTPDARAKLKEGIDLTYQGFLTRVAAGRKKKVEEIEPLAQGRVWLGVQARQNGLLDQLGGLDAAIDLLRTRAHIGAGDAVTLEVFPQRRSFFEQLFSRTEETTAPQPDAVTLLLRQAGPGVRPFLAGGLLRSVPYRLEFR